MAFCSNCGQQLVDGAKFCLACGARVNTTTENNDQRKSVYEGTIHKCPNCGDILDAYESVCESCGYERRGTKPTSSVQELAKKLQEIEAQRPPKKEASMFKQAKNFGQVSKTDEQKIDLIKNYSIPNNKEDIMEFAVLAASNIDADAFSGMNNQNPYNASTMAISNAWLVKLEQAYQKAKLVFNNDNRLLEIEKLYCEKQQAIRKAKAKPWKLVGIAWGSIIVIIAVVFTIIGIVNGTSKKNEQARLDELVVQIETALQENDYKLALMYAEQMTYSGPINANLERDWDIQQNYWYDRIIDDAAANGIVLDRPTEPTSQTKVTEPEPTPKTYFEEETYEVMRVKNMSLHIPNYWHEEGSENEYLQYYAETGDEVVMLSIAYPKESDDGYEVTFDGLYADNDNMIDAIANMYTDGDVVGYEVFETDSGIQGMLYRFTFKQKIDWIKKVDGSGYCFCFPSENDRRWFYITLMYTNNASIDEYKEDYLKIISSIEENFD